jgi:hypothetical protein
MCIQIWGLVAGIVAIFLPLIEAREIVEAIFGIGQLADARHRKAVAQNLDEHENNGDLPAKPSPSSSLGHEDIELGKRDIKAKEQGTAQSTGGDDSPYKPREP